MKPLDVRNASWAAVRERLDGERMRVWQWLLRSGPATTKGLAEASGMSLWNVRPRVCELCALGLVELVRKDGREGVYRACELREAESRHECARSGQATQMTLI